MHGHNAAGQFDLRGVSYAGIAGEANHGVAAAGTVKWSAMTSADSTGLPYLQLLFCQKTAVPRAAKDPLPSGLLAYFAMAACPDGWAQAALSQGRFVVGLPEKGAQAMRFGGAPLQSSEVTSRQISVEQRIISR